MTIFSIFVKDGTGVIEAIYFNQSYLENVLKTEGHVLLSGLINAEPQKPHTLQMKNPQYEIIDSKEDLLLHVGRIVPIYHETKGLSSRHLRRIMHDLMEEYHLKLQEVLPHFIRQKMHLPSIIEAIAAVHFPLAGSDIELLNYWRTLAHRRLAFEECFLLEIALAVQQHFKQNETPGISFNPTSSLISKLQTKLPFQLTKSQLRVINDIQSDMVSPHPMNRLLQGDVGSGKTLVALHAILLACESGYQTALMVPTETLAEQHFLNLQKYLESLGIEAELITGGQSQKKRLVVFQRITSGQIDLIVGTHALLEENIKFANLGLVVVDEQHKFGVRQRAIFQSKGLHPDVLVMTATPIPRTLAMTAYGDLDVSIIDALPPGRKPIQTRLFRHGERPRAYELLRRQVESGYQAFIVYPLIEESEKLDLEAAVQAVDRLQKQEFPKMKIGLLHGRMKSKEKAQIMRLFKQRVIHILVTTTIIEVGLDIPNATVILIEHADRFGLAQLHQLRGRVGRGTQRSFCLLVSSVGRRTSRKDSITEVKGNRLSQNIIAPELPLGMKKALVVSEAQAITQTAQERLKSMVHCSDGFAIAEQDLRIRGPGEFLGTRQWGMPEFKVMDLSRDAQLLEQAREEAFKVVKQDPHLSRPEHQILKIAMLRRWKTKLDLGSVG